LKTVQMQILPTGCWVKRSYSSGGGAMFYSFWTGQLIQHFLCTDGTDIALHFFFLYI